jgi:hypothetical protein
LSKPRDLSKLFSTSTGIATDVELISTVNSASAYALSEANDYTDSELSSIDLTSTINTASAAAFASASAYTDSAIASFEALPSQDGNAGKYLSTSGSVTSWEELDLNAAINTASAAAVNFLVDSAPGTLDTLNELSEALNDDPNFYSTIQAVYLSQSSASTTYLTQSNASTIYATKASPIFTGTVNFSSASVVGIDALPSQSENNGKYLTTDGIIASWSEITTDPTPTVFLLGGM